MKIGEFPEGAKVRLAGWYRGEFFEIRFKTNDICAGVKHDGDLDWYYLINEGWLPYPEEEKKVWLWANLEGTVSDRLSEQAPPNYPIKLLWSETILEEKKGV